ncbi:MAG: hypothetical protein ACJ764_04925 [Solirubrobacteraceae bacterium]
MRVVAYIPDLLFGSGVLTALKSAGHDPVLVGDPDALGRELVGARVLVVDLTADHRQRIDTVRAHRPDGLPVLGCYSHVEQEVRIAAEEAGFDQVVPRSRMAREGVALVERLSA